MHMTYFERIIMHIDVDLKTVRKLTRYISPKEIEKARYEKFNTPKINDGNLLCDKFFKKEELFNKMSDEIDYGYRSYGIDDLPVYYNGIREHDITHYSTQQCQYTLERRLPEYVTLLRNGKKIYTEKFEYLRDTNPIKMQINEALGKGCSLQNAINILDAAYIDINFKNDLFKGGLKLLREKYPLETVLHYIELSKLKDAKGNKSYVTGTFDFISQYPHLRDLIIHKDAYNCETLDEIGLKYIPKLLDKCKSEEDAVKIAKACQNTKQFNKEIVTDRAHLNLALHIYSKNQKWTKTDTALLHEIGNSTKKLEKTYNLLAEGYKPKDIVYILRSKIL